jgi:hypothetical protein
VYKHATDPLSLVFGIIYLGAAVLWALNLSATVSASTTRFVVPLVLIAAGAAGLVAAITRGRRSSKSSGSE